MSISWRLVSFTQSSSRPIYIIRCNQDRFLYYLSVYVKSFKELFLLLLVRGVFLKSECKSTNYFPNTQEFRRKSLKINRYLTIRMKKKRLSCLHSLYYTHGGRGLRVCGRTGKEKSRFQQQKPTIWFSNTPDRETQRIFMPYIHALIAEKRDPNCKTISPQLEKYFFPTGKLFFHS